MISLAAAVILGLVEGLTEFLPVSSTGHLILAGYLLDFKGPKAATFEIVIQMGAILSVVVIYWPRFLGLLRTDPARRFSGWRGLLLLAATSAPAALLGLLVHRLIKTHLFTPLTVAAALAVGAVAILAIEARPPAPRIASLDELDFKQALGIGLFQCLSLWPGFSRSAATIMGAMILGAGRRLAAEYSFIAAVPLLLAAGCFELAGSWSEMSAGDLLFLLVGFVISFASAWLAVKGFIHLLGRATLRPFAWYRLALVPLILIFWPKD